VVTGVTNVKRNETETNPNDSCDFYFKLHKNSTPPLHGKNAELVDGDGVYQLKEKQDGTDPTWIPAIYFIAHQIVNPLPIRVEECRLRGDGLTTIRKNRWYRFHLIPVIFFSPFKICTPPPRGRNGPMPMVRCYQTIKEKTDGTDPL